MVDNVIQEMPGNGDYPKFMEQQNKHKFIFRFPRAINRILYDPGLEVGPESASTLLIIPAQTITFLIFIYCFAFYSSFWWTLNTLNLVQVLPSFVLSFRVQWKFIINFSRVLQGVVFVNVSHDMTWELHLSFWRSNYLNYDTLISLSLFWFAESVQWIFEISAWDVIPADYIMIMSRSPLIASLRCALCVIFPSVKKQKHDFHFFRLMTIIRFVFYDIQNNWGLAAGYQPPPSTSLVNPFLGLDYSGYHKNLIQ